MAATGQQTSVKYTLTSPLGTKAVFNDDADANFVGFLHGDEALTGLDSPEVRATTYDRVGADGAVMPRVYYGARPITMQGRMHAGLVDTRNLRESRLRRVLNECRAADGTLEWTPAGSVAQYVNVRLHQPIRTKGGVAKDFFVGMIASDPHIYSVEKFTTRQYVNSQVTRLTNTTGAGGALTQPAITFPAAGTYTIEALVYLPSAAWTGGELFIEAVNYTGATQSALVTTNGVRNQWVRLTRTVTVLGTDLVGNIRWGSTGTPANGNWAELTLLTIGSTVGDVTHPTSLTPTANYSAAVQAPVLTGAERINQLGDAVSLPSLIRLVGPGTGPQARNATMLGADDFLDLPALVLAAGEHVDIDVLHKTVTKNTGVNLYNELDLDTTWLELLPGGNNVIYTVDSGSSSASQAEWHWRHAWV